MCTMLVYITYVFQPLLRCTPTNLSYVPSYFLVTGNIYWITTFAVLILIVYFHCIGFMVYRAIKIIVANIVSMVHAYWSCRVITYITHKTIWKKHKNTIVKKGNTQHTLYYLCVLSQSLLWIIKKINRCSLLSKIVALLLSLSPSLPCFLSIASPSLQSQPWPSIAASSLQW